MLRLIVVVVWKTCEFCQAGRVEQKNTCELHYWTFSIQCVSGASASAALTVLSRKPVTSELKLLWFTVFPDLRKLSHYQKSNSDQDCKKIRPATHQNPAPLWRLQVDAMKDGSLTGLSPGIPPLLFSSIPLFIHPFFGGPPDPIKAQSVHPTCEGSVRTPQE